MRILLINPPFQRLSKVASTYFPLGLGYLAAFLEKEGYDVKIYNAELACDSEKNDWVTINSNRKRMMAQDNLVQALSNENHPAWQNTRKVIEEFHPSLVGITVTSSAYPCAGKIAKIVKSVDNTIITVLGGMHATIEPVKALENHDIDIVAIGEGEVTLSELAKKLHKKELWDTIEGIAFRKNGQVNINEKRGFVDDLDTLPFPARHLDIYPDYYGSSGMGGLVTGRGCPANCTFCNAKNLWSRKVRFRSVENVCSEIAQIQAKYDPTYLLFYDDTFTIQRKRVIEICNFLINKESRCGWGCFTRADCVDDELLALMKKAGCSTIGLGLESGSQKMLALLDKGESLASILEASRKIKHAGISLGITCMVGMPHETEEDIHATIKVIEEIKADFTNINTFTPYPGTPLYEYCLKHGLITGDFDWARLSQHSHYNNFSRFLTLEKFISLRDKLIEAADQLNEKAQSKSDTAPIAQPPITLTARFIRKLKKIFSGKETLGSLKNSVYRNLRDFYFMSFLPTVSVIDRKITLALNVIFAVTIARLCRGNGVLHIMHASHVGFVLTRALREAGVKANYLAIGNSFLQYDKGAYDYYISTKNAPDGFVFQSLAPKAFANNVLFWKLVLSHHIIHSHTLNSITASSKEFWLLKLAGRKLVFHFRGCDVRDKNEVDHAWPFLNCCRECDYPADVCFDRNKKHRFERAKKYGNVFLVTTPDLLLHVPNAQVVSFLPPPQQLLESLQRSRDYRLVTRFKICHATNHPGIDGTKYVHAAVQRLTAEGYNIELKIVSKVPFLENLKMLSDCDISVGKLKMGYLANAQIESMALGIPTFCFVREEFLRYTNAAPIINTGIHSVYEKLKYYLDNPDELTMISQKSIEFTKKTLNEGRIVNTLKEIYRAL